MDISFANLEETWSVNRNQSVSLHSLMSRPDNSTARIDRPKTVPAFMKSDQNADTIHNHRTSMPSDHRSYPSSVKTDCSRLIQLEQNPRRKKLNSGNTITAVKRPSKPVWMMASETMTPCVVGPGYVLSRSKSKLHVQLYETDTGTSKEGKDRTLQVTSKPIELNSNERDSLIALLQQQIEDPMLNVEEEKLNHKETKRLASEHLKVKIDDISCHYRNEIETLEANNLKKLASLREEHVEQMVECRNRCDEDIRKLRREIELLQAAFEAYKRQLTDEMNEKFGHRLNEASQQLTAETLNQMQELRARLTSEKLAEKADVENAYQEKMNRLKVDHKQQISELRDRYSESATDLEKLKQTEASLLETQKELSHLQDVYQNNSLQLDGCKVEMDHMKMKLIGWEERFDSRIKKIDADYREEADERKKQLSELRILYIKKCCELHDLKHSQTVSLDQRVMSAKEVMKVVVETRARTAVSLASIGDPVLERLHRKPKTRPLSAPITREEIDRAAVNAGITVETGRRQPLG